MSITQPYLRELIITLVAGSDVIKIKSDGTMNSLKVTCSISKTIMGIPNPSTISIYNLSEATRSAIQKSLSKITVEAGWSNTEKHIAFSGNIMSCTSERNGTDIITKLTCLQGYNALVKGITSKTYAEGTPIKDVVKDMGATFEEVTITDSKLKGIEGSIGAGGWSYSGTTKEGLTQLANEYGFSWSIDDDSLSAVGDTAKFDGLLQLNGTKGGLINISPVLTGPMQMQTGVKIKSVYVPGVVPGSSVKVQSTINKYLDGTYRIHTANFSLDTFSNGWTMDLESFNYL